LTEDRGEWRDIDKTVLVLEWVLDRVEVTDREERAADLGGRVRFECGWERRELGWSPSVISKQSKTNLRYALYQAALVTCSKNPYGSDPLCEEASGPRARERDSHEDQGEEGGQAIAIGHCLDADEEEREG